MINELKKMFDFLKLRKGETKKDYKKRINERGNEILNGINCSLEEQVNLKALCNMSPAVLRFKEKLIFLRITEDEYDARKGNAKDYEKYVFATLFNDFDEEEFKEHKRRIYNELVNNYYVKQNEYENMLYSVEEKFFDKLLADEKIEKQYRKIINE